MLVSFPSIPLCWPLLLETTVEAAADVLPLPSFQSCARGADTYSSRSSAESIVVGGRWVGGSACGMGELSPSATWKRVLG
jgi:hypothetical protein